MMMSEILGIVIGYKSNNLKIVKYIVIGFGIYMMLPSISLILLYVAGLLNPDIMAVFNNMEVSSNAMKSTMMVGIIVYAIYIFIAYFVGNKLLNKGVNVY